MPERCLLAIGTNLPGVDHIRPQMAYLPVLGVEIRLDNLHGLRREYVQYLISHGGSPFQAAHGKHRPYHPAINPPSKLPRTLGRVKVRVVR
jgi:hypothetical protein